MSPISAVGKLRDRAFFRYVIIFICRTENRIPLVGELFVIMDYSLYGDTSYGVVVSLIGIALNGWH